MSFIKKEIMSKKLKCENKELKAPTIEKFIEECRADARKRGAASDPFIVRLWVRFGIEEGRKYHQIEIWLPDKHVQYSDIQVCYRLIADNQEEARRIIADYLGTSPEKIPDNFGMSIYPFRKYDEEK
jgi:hypothetical protein